jgi:hypothetical protein
MQTYESYTREKNISGELLLQTYKVKSVALIGTIWLLVFPFASFHPTIPFLIADRRG